MCQTFYVSNLDRLYIQNYNPFDGANMRRRQAMDIIIRQDGKGFLAEVDGTKNLFAYGKTKKEASEELLHVIDMMLDYHQEQIKLEKKIKSKLLKDQIAYAV